MLGKGGHSTKRVVVDQRGNLHGSLPGCVTAASGHLLIYAFYVVAERPFVRSTYVTPCPAQMITLAPR